jgi:hypothetical protein
LMVWSILVLHVGFAGIEDVEHGEEYDGVV